MATIPADLSARFHALLDIRRFRASEDELQRRGRLSGVTDITGNGD